MNKINWHNVKMVVGIIILGVIGFIQAVHGKFPGSETLDAAVPTLLLIEHFALGNTGSM